MTSYDVVIDRFITKIKKDKKYFKFKDTDETTALDMIKRRSLELLINASDEITPLISFTQNVDFSNRDDDIEIFNFDLTSIEIDLLTDLMVVKLYDEETITLKNMQKYLGKDIEVFSPAKERDSFLALVKYKHSEFEKKLGNYNIRDRKTGKPLMAY